MSSRHPCSSRNSSLALLLLTLFSFCLENRAQEAPPASSNTSLLNQLAEPTSIGGFIDSYYDYNANLPSANVNSYRSFDTTTNTPALNLVELNFDKAPDAAQARFGYHVSVYYGHAADAINTSASQDAGVDRWLKEGYLTYLAPIGKSGMVLDVGKFVTPAGAEVIETKDNWNYSRSLLFSYAIPYFHFGIRAKYTFSDKYTVTGFLMNGWNNLVYNVGGKPLTPGVSFAWSPTKKISLTQTFMIGQEQPGNSSWRQLWDTVAAYNPNSKLSFMLNFDYGRGDRVPPTSSPVYWSGVAGYVKYAFHGKYALATRYEYLNDHNGFTTGTPQGLSEVTGTFERTFTSHVLSRIEYRRDFSSQSVFPLDNGPASQNQDTATAGLVLIFNHSITQK
jgi:hypothetical protein